MVGDIGCQISRYAVVADDDTVFVVAVVCRFQPQRTVFFINLAPFFQDLAGCLDGIGMERPFAEPVIVMDVEMSQVPFEGLEFFCIGPILEQFQPFCFRHVQIFIAVLVDDGLGRFDDVMAVIAVFRDFRRLAQEFQITGVDRRSQVVHLVAGIVDVIFSLDVIACSPQEVDQGTAISGTAAVADVERPRRVGTDVFDLDRVFLPKRCMTISVTGCQDLFERIVDDVVLQEEIDEAGTGDFSMVEPGVIHAVDDGLGNDARCLMGDAGRLHGDVAGKITEFLLRRYFQGDIGIVASGKRAGCNSLVQGFRNALLQ